MLYRSDYYIYIYLYLFKFIIYNYLYMKIPNILLNFFFLLQFFYVLEQFLSSRYKNFFSFFVNIEIHLKSI